MDDDQLGQAAAAWIRGKKTAAALAELFVIVVKLGSNQEAMMRHLGLWPSEEPGVVAEPVADGQASQPSGSAG